MDTVGHPRRLRPSYASPGAQVAPGAILYQGRLGAWQRTGRVELHRAYGHIAKGQVKQTCKLVGGSPIPHGRDCVCEACGDWLDAELDEDDEAMNAAFRLKAPGADP